MRLEKKQPVVKDAAPSRLLQLPPELRLQIWQYALEDIASDPHLHVFDEILDACPYLSHTNCSRQTGGIQTALLRTCHSVYDEASPFLFEDRRFVLVLQAGNPRCRSKKHVGEDNRTTYKRCCRSFGKLQKCETFLRRIKSATIIVQPGRKPNLDKLTPRIFAFLEASDYGRHMDELGVCFNFHYRMKDQKLASAIVMAFLPKAPRLAPKKHYSLGMPSRHPHLFAGRPCCAFREVLQKRGLDVKHIQRWEPDTYPPGSCTHRGFWGECGDPMTYLPSSSPGWKGGLEIAGEIAQVSLCLGLAVVLWPVTAAMVVKRKYDKGEW